MVAGVRRAALAVGLFALAAASLALGGPARLVIVSPSGQNPVFDEVAFAVEVVGDAPVERVEFFVDGRSAGVDREAPFRVRVDVGSHNAEHRFRAVATLRSGAQVADALETPRFEANDEATYDLQQLYVTAVADGRRVLDLERGEFAVGDAGAAQRIVTFARGDVPFTAVILLDASASMRGAKLDAALAGARRFAEAMAGNDEAKLIAFSDRLLAESPFVGPGAALVAETAGLVARGGTALNDQLYVALKSVEQRQGRRVVVILSDGLDSHSVLNVDNVLPQVWRSRALIYWVRLGVGVGAGAAADRDPGHQHTPWRDGKAHLRQVEGLAEAAERSGGRVVPVAAADGIGAALAEILAELREQYVLSYYPSTGRGDGAWHPVEVRTTRRGVSLRTSAGYYDF